jgi:membrane protease YdiL (CAAX protease family)
MTFWCTIITLGYPAMLAAPTLAAILLTGLAYGKAGFRELLSRLLRWRVGIRWYAVALLIAPLTMLAVLLTLSLVSPAFRPLLFVEEDPFGLLLFSVVVGLWVGIFEELGWIGFAVPTLLGRRSRVLGTGLIVGFLYAAWSFLIVYLSQASDPTPGTLPMVIFLAVSLFTWLPAYRVLMVWVYERTNGSLLVVMLMSASFVVAWNSLNNALAQTLTTLTAFYLVMTVVWCAIVAVVALAQGGHLTREPPPRRRVA